MLALGVQQARARLFRLLGRSLDELYGELRPVARPVGHICSAGHDYVYIRRNGDVFPCVPYAVHGTVQGLAAPSIRILCSCLVRNHLNAASATALPVQGGLRALRELAS